MSKYLNLDQLVQEERVVTIGGVQHTMKEMSVEDFIVLQQEAGKLSEDASMGEQIEALVKMIARSFPTMKEAELRALPLRHLNAILEFTRESGEKVVEADAEKR